MNEAHEPSVHMNEEGEKTEERNRKAKGGSKEEK